MALRCAWVEFFVFRFLSHSAGKGYFKKNCTIFQHMSTVGLFLYKPSLITPVKCWTIGSSTEIHLVNQNRFSLNSIGESKPILIILHKASAQLLAHLVLTTDLRGRLSGWASVIDCRDPVQRFPFDYIYSFIRLSNEYLLCAGPMLFWGAEMEAHRSSQQWPLFGQRRLARKNFVKLRGMFRCSHGHHLGVASKRANLKITLMQFLLYVLKTLIP